MTMLGMLQNMVFHILLVGGEFEEKNGEDACLTGGEKLLEAILVMQQSSTYGY